ncbi:amino acid ABC transporter substrate-binding protein, partial [Paraburkholderia rhynchosiae]
MTLAGFYAGLGLTTAAYADSSSRLDRIKETGTITVGYPTTSLPFA